jgi:calpain-15
MEAPVATEISPGITLIRKTVSRALQVLEILNSKTDVLEFTINLTGSRGVIIQETGSFERTVQIGSGKQVVLASIELKGDWKLIQKFSFVSKPPPREQVQSQIAKGQRGLQEQAGRCYELISRKAVDTLTPRDVHRRVGNYVDPHFYPGDQSVFVGSNLTQLQDTAIQWRRPSEFMSGQVKLFEGDIEPNDIRQGKLGDCWFMCALSALAERPDLVRRLFLIEEINEEGIYRVRFCKDGEWIKVTVDDYFPCFPKATGECPN